MVDLATLTSTGLGLSWCTYCTEFQYTWKPIHEACSNDLRVSRGTVPAELSWIHSWAATMDPSPTFCLFDPEAAPSSPNMATKGGPYLSCSSIHPIPDPTFSGANGDENTHHGGPSVASPATGGAPRALLSSVCWSPSCSLPVSSIEIRR